MVKFSKVFLLAGSVCLASPVLAAEIDDDDDGDYSAAPIVYKYNASKKKKQVAKKVEQPVVEPSEVVADSDDDYDDGDYSAAPIVYKKKSSKQEKSQAKAVKKAKPRASKDPIGKLASAKSIARVKWNSRSDIEPFE